MRLQPATGTPPGLEELDYSGRTWDHPSNLLRGQISAAERMPSAILSPSGASTPWPRSASLDLSSRSVIDPLTGRAMTVDTFLDARLCTDALMVVKDGAVVHEDYRRGMTDSDVHLVHSCTKTLTTMMVGVAICAGHLDPSTPMQELVVELAGLDAWSGVTLQHVLDMAAGLDTEEHYEDPQSMYWRYADSVGYYASDHASQIGALEFVRRELVVRAVEPGSLFNYASYLTNLLPIVLERAYGRPAVEMYEECLFSRIGAESDAVLNVDAVGAPIVEGQLSLTLRDFGRWAFPFANEGRSLTGERVIPLEWIEETLSSSTARASAFARSDYADAFPGAQYHNQAWILDPAEGVLAMLGIHGQFAYVDAPNRLMIVGMGSFPSQANALLTASMRTLWQEVASAASE